MVGEVGSSDGVSGEEQACDCDVALPEYDIEAGEQQSALCDVMERTQRIQITVLPQRHTITVPPPPQCLLVHLIEAHINFTAACSVAL